MDKVAIVIDNGTGFTKMGYAGNLDMQVTWIQIL